jgi:23S rRNA (pseudouridine1915-N3)-methyltransferase
MRIVIAAVGRMRAGAMHDLYDEYVRRLKWAVTLREVEVRGKLAPAAMRTREGELLQAEIPERARLVALDGGGKALSSEELAASLGGWRDGGTETLAFAIGGAEGLDPALLKRAQMTLSLGKMTWPHMLVRVMLAEQLYRAQSILQGHPYHRGG